LSHVCKDYSKSNVGRFFETQCSKCLHDTMVKRYSKDAISHRGM